MRNRLTGTAAQERMVSHLKSEVAKDIGDSGHARTRRRISTATSKARVAAFERFLRVLVVGHGHTFNTCASFGEKQYRLYATWCVSHQLSAGTLGNAHSQLKHVINVVLGKGESCIKEAEIYYGDLTRRTHICESSKAWEDHALVDEDGEAVTPESVRARMAPISEGAFLMLELCHLLGLRAKESLFFRPHRDVQDSVIVVRPQGAKNGRRREVDLALLPLAEREKLTGVLSRCADLVTDEDGTLLNPRALSIKWVRQRRKFYYWLGLAGITKAQLGISVHGLRHGFLQRSQEHLSGQPVPVHGALSPSMVADPRLRALNAVTRLMTSELAGHSRTSVTGSYYGSPFEQFRQSGGTKPEWGDALRWVRDVERGDVEGLQKRLAQLSDEGVDLATLAARIIERAKLARPQRPYA